MICSVFVIFFCSTIINSMLHIRKFKSAYVGGKKKTNTYTHIWGVVWYFFLTETSTLEHNLKPFKTLHWINWVCIKIGNSVTLWEYKYFVPLRRFPRVATRPGNYLVHVRNLSSIQKTDLAYFRPRETRFESDSFYVCREDEYAF